ncbi:hypothetical protein BJ546DRAFT_946797 [Cryomyces antarcticus]
MSWLRTFGTAARTLVRRTRFDRKKLPAPFDSAVKKFTAPWGGAEQDNVYSFPSRLAYVYRDLDPFRRCTSSAWSRILVFPPTPSDIYHRSRDGNPLYQSRMNPKDKELIISARIKGKLDEKTCHISSDGSGTTNNKDVI